jgi:hypothetical protein
VIGLVNGGLRKTCAFPDHARTLTQRHNAISILTVNGTEEKVLALEERLSSKNEFKTT